jgi:hypothetical protein
MALWVMQLAPSDVRIERFRVLDNWNVRATQLSTGISNVVFGSDDLGRDRQEAIKALGVLLDDIELVRSMICNGSSADDAASALVKQRERSLIPAIKAMRYGGALDLGEAKAVVYRNLSSSAQEAVERLWDAAEASLSVDEPDVRTLLAFVIAATEFDGKPELAAQVPFVRIVGGPITFLDLAVEEPRVGRSALVHGCVPGQCWVLDDRGEAIGGP